MASDQFSLCWDNFHKNMSSGMHSLLENEDLVDVTLAIEGQYLKAHKMVLSVCSPYFRTLFSMNPCKHPIVFMKDVSYLVMNDLLTFMYQGEVQVNQENLATFIKTAEALQIKGLTGDSDLDEVPEEISKPLKRAITTTEEPKLKRSKPTVPLPTPIKKQKNVPLLQAITPISPMPPKLVPASAPKVEPVSNENLIQFKMEPYDGDQANNDTFDDSQAENYDDALEDTTHDDTEDYSMMEGDEEPQAGTSADGIGDSQEYNCDVTELIPSRVGIVSNGFRYHQNSRIDKTARYLICSEYVRLSCRARATIPKDGTVNDIVLRTEHNHPPVFDMKDRDNFVSCLKHLIATDSDIPLRRAYQIVQELYLGCAEHKKNGCRARAILPADLSIDQIRITREHNHPPDQYAEEKDLFIKHLKKAVKDMSGPLKKVYENVKILYPHAVEDITFKSICSSLHRWRKEP